ncbi:MAG TPA: hypothetical protein VL899_11095 [Alphaproteobacteria bacterium]|nr:hypothetical protein [Alphaproteobacteria bacterium]
MPSNATNEATRAEWRELGFYYDQDAALKAWKLIGSATGLLGFANRLRRYASHPEAQTLGEHIHLGPYGYLEVGTSVEPEITDHWIAGPPQDLARLAQLIVVAINDAKLGATESLRADYAPDSPFDLAIEVREEGFDPASEDKSCW